MRVCFSNREITKCETLYIHVECEMYQLHLRIGWRIWHNVNGRCSRLLLSKRENCVGERKRSTWSAECGERELKDGIGDYSHLCLYPPPTQSPSHPLYSPPCFTVLRKRGVEAPSASSV